MNAYSTTGYVMFYDVLIIISSISYVATLSVMFASLNRMC